MLTQLLLNPAVNRIIADLDNTASMSSIVMRDVIDNAGRITQAYKRDRHEGREQFIELNATTVIWGFGIRYMKRWFDRAVAGLSRKGVINVHLPHLNMSLLEQGPQQLTPQVVERYTTKNSSLQKHLLDLAMNRKGVVGAYKAANVVKFGVATFLPILLIAFGIPTLNQWITRRKLQEERQKAVQAGRAAPSGYQVIPTDGPLKAPVAFQRFSQQIYSPSPQALRFGGGLMNSMYHLLQNERANTLLIDGTISGGRTYKARNIYERAEVLFSEAAIIYFLFFAATPIQRFFQKTLDRLFGIHTALEFQGLKKIHDQYGQYGQYGQVGKHAETLSAHIGRIEKELGGFKSLKGLSKAETAKTLLEFEKQMVARARDYVHAGKSGHLLWDVARACQFIPTVKNSGGKAMLDLTQKLDAEGIYKLGCHMKQLAASAEEKGLKKLVSRSIVGKAAAFLLATGVCTVFLGWIIPRTKQQITYWMTGEYKFPGVLNNGERQNLLAVG